MKVLVVEYLSGGGLRELQGPDAVASADLLAQGTAMRDALAADLARVAGCELSVADAAGAIAPRPGESMLDFVQRSAPQHHRVWVVAPENGGLLRQMQEAVGARRWIGCDAASIRIASSKRATLQCLAAADVLTPLAFMGSATDGAIGSETDSAIDSATRFVVKPDDGAGAIDTHVHATRAAADADLSARPGAVLEAWVDGEAMSLSLLCDSGRAELLAINRQRVHVDDDGCVRYEGVDVRAVALRDERAAALRGVTYSVAGALPGLQGYVGVDLVWHASRGPVVIEINPRLTSAYVGLSAALDRNVAAAVLALHAGDRGHR